MDIRLFEKEVRRELDFINNKIKKLQGEIFQFRYGITAEDEFFSKLINEEKNVGLVFCSGDKLSGVIKKNFRHSLVVYTSSNTNIIVQKSSLKYINF